MIQVWHLHVLTAHQGGSPDGMRVAALWPLKWPVSLLGHNEVMFFGPNFSLEHIFFTFVWLKPVIFLGMSATDHRPISKMSSPSLTSLAFCSFSRFLLPNAVALRMCDLYHSA